MKTIDDEVVPEALRFMTDAKDERHARSSSGSTPRTCTSAPTSRTAAGARPAAGSRSTTTRCSTTTSWSARCWTSSTSNGLADNTIVMYSTDNGPHMNTLARRRHDAVPQREELQLGGRLPGAGDGPLARPDPGRHGAQRDRQPQRLVRHAARGGRRHRRRRPAQGRAPTWPARRTRCTSTGTTSSTTSPARPTRARASTSSTSPTTAT